jgi:hypothetical protein
MQFIKAWWKYIKDDLGLVDLVIGILFYFPLTILYLALVYSPDWSSLRRLNGTAWVKSSYIWFLLVPTAAYLLQDIGPNITFALGDKAYQIPIGLPFSWQLFYLGAVCFAVGGLIYQFWCPPLIRDYDGFVDFRDEGRGGSYIIEQMQDVVDGRAEMLDALPAQTIDLDEFEESLFLDRLQESDFGNFLLDYTDIRMIVKPARAAAVRHVYNPLRFLPFSMKHIIQDWWSADRKTKRLQRPYSLIEERLPDAFWYARNVSEKRRDQWRWQSFRLYAIGLLLHLAVAWQGFQYVYQLTNFNAFWQLF